MNISSTVAGKNEESISISMVDLLGVKKNQVAALMVVGHRLYKQGRLKDAVKIFEGLTVLESNNAYVHGILGSLYQKQGQYEPALVRYNNALTLFPEDLNSLTNRGEIFVKLGRFQEAAEDFKKAIHLDPTGCGQRWNGIFEHFRSTWNYYCGGKTDGTYFQTIDDTINEFQADPQPETVELLQNQVTAVQDMTSTAMKSIQLYQEFSGSLIANSLKL